MEPAQERAAMLEYERQLGEEVPFNAPEPTLAERISQIHPSDFLRDGSEMVFGNMTDTEMMGVFAGIRLYAKYKETGDHNEIGAMAEALANEILSNVETFLNGS